MIFALILLLVGLLLITVYLILEVNRLDEQVEIMNYDLNKLYVNCIVEKKKPVSKKKIIKTGKGTKVVVTSTNKKVSK